MTPAPALTWRMFTRDGKQAHCPHGAWNPTGACDGEIAYHDVERKELKCLKCGTLFVVCEIEQHNLVRWS